MAYQNEWLLLEAEDYMDEVEHREMNEEFQFYHAVSHGNIDEVRKNCEQGMFVKTEHYPL